MGKIFHGVAGRIKGSVGNTTFRRIYGEANASAMYDKVLEVSNPRTGSQILQRMRLAPAQKFYETFKQVMDHSRQGIQAGEKTRRAFMAEVMSKGFSSMPYVPKGFQGVVGERYPLSKGTLPRIFAYTNVSMEWADVELVMDPSDHYDTPAALLANLQSRNPGRFEDGDELTFVALCGDDVSGNESYSSIFSVVLSAADTDTVIEERISVSESDRMIFNPLFFTEDDALFGVGVIHSRKVGNGWTYSSAAMDFDQDYYMVWHNGNAYRTAMASYGAAGFNEPNGRKQLKLATNQPYNGAITKANGLLNPNKENELKFVYLMSTTQIVDSSKQAQVVTSVFVKDGALVNEKGEVIKKTEGGQQVPVTPQMVGWAGGTRVWKDAYLVQVPE